MELKFIGKRLQGGVRLFKLYLYGIEIWRLLLLLVSVRMFKLYLYGIEMWVRGIRCQARLVQIVPLWN